MDGYVFQNTDNLAIELPFLSDQSAYMDFLCRTGNRAHGLVTVGTVAGVVVVREFYLCCFFFPQYVFKRSKYIEIMTYTFVSVRTSDRYESNRFVGNYKSTTSLSFCIFLSVFEMHDFFFFLLNGQTAHLPTVYIQRVLRTEEHTARRTRQINKSSR